MMMDYKVLDGDMTPDKQALLIESKNLIKSKIDWHIVNSFKHIATPFEDEGFVVELIVKFDHLYIYSYRTGHDDYDISELLFEGVINWILDARVSYYISVYYGTGINMISKGVLVEKLRSKLLGRYTQDQVNHIIR